MSLLDGNKLDASDLYGKVIEGPGLPSHAVLPSELGHHVSDGPPLDSHFFDGSLSNRLFTGDGPSTLTLGVIGILCLIAFDAFRGEKSRLPWKIGVQAFANFAIATCLLALRLPLFGLSSAQFALTRFATRSRPLIRQTFETLSDDGAVRAAR